jgi:hypothetical protein
VSLPFRVARRLDPIRVVEAVSSGKMA